ncbi:MAG: hypothetical protein HYV06_03555 [Deltaproteobacteria bacterium]|nr:hypothetical protein [Deltaproteobacteria bacterium]
MVKTLELYDMLKGKLGEAESKALLSIIEETSDAVKHLEQKELATKNDIKDLEVKLAETKADLIRWVVGAGFLQTALICALLLRLIK